MTIEERLTRAEENLGRLAAVQDQMMDVLGFTLEGERRLATRMERAEELQTTIQENHRKLEATVQEIGDKLNGLIGIVDGLIHRG